MVPRIIFISIISATFSFAQFHEINISYERNEQFIKDEKIYVIEELNEKVANYFKNNNFSPEFDYLDIHLEINIIYHKINFIDKDNYNGVKCQINFSNQRDGLNYFTKNINLPYNKSSGIYFNTFVFDPLASFLDFYAYIFIANELDTYGLYLGEQYYSKALEMTKMGLDGNSNIEQWKKNETIVELNKENSYLRNIKYNFFLIMDDNDSEWDIYLKKTKELMLLNLENLNNVFEKYGYEKFTLRFLNKYKDDFAYLFDLLDIENGIKFLIKFDYENKLFYEKFLNE